MPDLSIAQPYPDAGHEAIRLAVVRAIEDLGYALDLSDTTLLLLDSALRDLTVREQASGTNLGRIQQVETDVAALQTQVTDLTTRLAALEAAKVV